MEHRITHACGHEQAHLIPGFASQQERKARWLRTTACRACFIAGKRAEEAATAARHGDTIARLPLAALVGSERQVTWATTIRAKRLAALMAGGEPSIAGHPCLAISEATWWIDRRDATDGQLVAAAETHGPQVQDRGRIEVSAMP